MLGIKSNNSVGPIEAALLAGLGLSFVIYAVAR